MVENVIRGTFVPPGGKCEVCDIWIDVLAKGEGVHQLINLPLAPFLSISDADFVFHLG